MSKTNRAQSYRYGESTACAGDLEARRKEIENVLDGIIARAVVGERRVLSHMNRIMTSAAEEGFNMRSYRDIYDELRADKRTLPNFAESDPEISVERIKKIIRDHRQKSDI